MRIFLIGDLHLDHANIIRYCNRPFSSVREMNKTIIHNWNKTVKRDDLVYFLGDMAFGKSSKNTDHWLKKLKGKIIFIRGNHDRSKKIRFVHDMILRYKNHKFLLIHNPENLQKQGNGWIIHGHHHNHDLKNYPFISGERKTINVGVELINYKPLDINKLFNLNFENIKTMETIDSLPIIKK